MDDGGIQLREQLAAIEHQRWADWQSYLHSCCRRNDDGSLTIPAELVNRWDRQIATPYADLPEQSKDSDREQVDRYWPLIQQWAIKKWARDDSDSQEIR
jgi:hypothetical protein